MGMKREAVQEERQKNQKDQCNINDVNSPHQGESEYSQSQSCFISLIEDPNLSAQERHFLDRLIDSEINFYPKPETIAEIVT